MPDIIKWPSNAIQVNKTCRLFAERSQFQNILGAIDGSHIHITAPKHLHQAYFNRKGFYSIVLLASCDATLAFNYVWTGNPGSTHDSTVLRQSDLFAQSNERIPPGFCLLGDSGFPLLGWLVTPFRDHGNLTRQQKLFNKTHSRCREVIERAFGMLKNRFRRLYRFEMLDLTLLVNNVLAACVLHNICISEDDGDLPIEPQQPNAAENFDDTFARDGHELQGVQLRQQLMQQLLNI
ncbi:putative nuclease HARBI1 [Saccostrea cucullata]|uniref:putative nuclease HARBI1 n=1 Tax=Saccostrea cuccullata TaxID=36930 RepID=UPI002ED1E443